MWPAPAFHQGPRPQTAFRIAPDILPALREIKVTGGLPIAVQVNFALEMVPDAFVGVPFGTGSGLLPCRSCSLTPGRSVVASKRPEQAFVIVLCVDVRERPLVCD